MMLKKEPEAVLTILEILDTRLLNLRETFPLAYKGPRSQVKRQLKIGKLWLLTLHAGHGS